MAELSQIDELAAARGLTLRPAEREALGRLHEGSNTAWFHGRDIEIEPLIELAAALTPGPTLVFRVGAKAGKGWKALQAERLAKPGKPIDAALTQLKDAEFTRAAVAAGTKLVVFTPADELLETLRVIPEGMARFHAFYDELGRPPLVFASPHAAQSLLEELTAQLDIAVPERSFIDYFRSNVMFEVLTAPPGERKPRLAARIAEELPGQGIFYCGSARQAKALATYLAQQNIETSAAHPQQRAADRALAIDDFAKARTRALVTAGYPGNTAARAARFCVHYDMPPGLERYYFEAVSTGPADKPARAVLLFERADYAQMGAKSEAKDPTPGEAAAMLKLLREAGVPIALGTLAETAGLSAKKARTLAALLKDGGFVIDERLGLRIAPGLDDRAAAAAVNEFRTHRETERRGFQDVVAYAESGICRVKLLMRFFGQGELEPCGLCDNCRKGKEQRVRAASRKHAQSRSGRWSRGDVVRHAAWGEGEVKQVWGDKLRVHFPGLGEKVIKAEFVQAPE